MTEDIRAECKVLFKTIHADIKDIKGDAKVIRAAVVGNGNPKSSLSSRITRIETLWLIFFIFAAMVSFAATAYGIIAAIK